MRARSMRRVGLVTSIAWASLCACKASAYMGYAPGDWVLFTDYTSVLSFAESPREVWMSTPDALLHIDKFNAQWKLPLSRYELGLHDPIERVGYDGKTNQLVILSHASVYAFSPDMLNSGSLFWGQGSPTAFPGNGCPQKWPLFAIDDGMFDPMHGSIRDAQLVEHGMIACYHDAWNAQWISFDGLGVYRAEGTSPFLTRKVIGLRDARASVVRRYDDRIWVAPNALGPARSNFRTLYQLDGPAPTADPRGISSLDPSSGEAQVFEMALSKLPIQGVNALIPWNGEIAIGTDNGFYTLDASTGFVRYPKRSVRLPGDQVRDLAVMWGRLFVGTDNGMATVDSSTWTVSQDSAAFSHMRVNRFRVHHDTLWCAAEHGLWYRAAWEKGWSADTSVGVPGRAGWEVNDVLWDGDSVMYIADPQGLAIVNRDQRTADDVGRVQPHTINEDATSLANGSRSTTVSSIAGIMPLGQFGEVLELDAAGPYVWAATSNGLLRIRRDTHHYRVYTQADGLPTTRVTSLFADDDYVWVGTQRGLVRFWWNSRDRDDD